jgi:hypothetical protein
MIKTKYRFISILLAVVIALTCIPAKSSAVSITANQLNAVIFANGKYVAVGAAGTIFTSSDGVTWTSRSMGTTTNLNAITYGAGQFVVVGDGGLEASSTDGISWTSGWTSVSSNLNVISFNSITGMFVSAGPTPWSTITTTNVSGWTKAATSNYPKSIIFDGTSFVGISAHTMAQVSTSTNGSTWSLVSTATGTLNSIAYGNGVYVSVGSSGLIATSTDKVTWTNRVSGTSNTLNSITYNSGTFVAVGQSGTVLTSSDGINWASGTSGTTQTLNGVTNGNGTFIAVGLGGTISTISVGSPSINKILSLSQTSTPTFASVTLSGSSANTTGSTSWSIVDSRGSGAGWSVTLSVTDLVSGSIIDPSSLGSGTMTVKIPASAVAITSTVVSVISGQPFNPTYGPSGYNINLSISPQRVLNASPGYGMGNYKATINFRVVVPTTVIVNSLSGTGSKYLVGSIVGTRAATYSSSFVYTTSVGI